MSKKSEETVEQSTLNNRLLQTAEGRKAWHQERVVLETTELVCRLMEQENVSRSELALRLGKTKGYITQLLDGSANMTLRTISDIFLALGFAFHPNCIRLTGESESQILVEHEDTAAELE